MENRIGPLGLLSGHWLTQGEDWERRKSSQKMTEEVGLEWFSYLVHCQAMGWSAKHPIRRGDLLGQIMPNYRK
jgi:hypothetical protein